MDREGGSGARGAGGGEAIMGGRRSGIQCCKGEAPSVGRIPPMTCQPCWPMYPE